MTGRATTEDEKERAETRAAAKNDEVVRILEGSDGDEVAGGKGLMGWEETCS